MCLIASKRTRQKKSTIALHIAFSIFDGFVVATNIVLLVKASFFFLLRMVRFSFKSLDLFWGPKLVKILY